MGRGNLNLNAILLIFIVKNLFKLFLEYILEYCSLDFLNFYLHDVSEGAPTAELQIELSKAAIGPQLGRDRLTASLRAQRWLLRQRERRSHGRISSGLARQSLHSIDCDR